MFNSVPLRHSIDFQDQKLTLETGLLALQATASVVATIGETTVMANVVVGKVDMNIDYFPLQIIYEEKMYASGKIRGSRFEKREGKPSDTAVLAGRAVDRSLRSLFNENFRNSVQVVITILSVDEVNSPDILAILAGSSALSLATSSFQGPVSGVRVGLTSEKLKVKSEKSAVDNSPLEGWQSQTDGVDQSDATNNGDTEAASTTNPNIIINPSYLQMETSDLDLIVSGDGDNIMMVEAGANIVDEEIMGNCLDAACKELKVLTDFQSEFITLAKSKGLAKQVPLTAQTIDGKYYDYWKNYTHQIENIMYGEGNKEEKNTALMTYEKHHKKALDLAKKFKQSLNEDFRNQLEEFDAGIAQTVLNLVEDEFDMYNADSNLFKAFHSHIGDIVKNNILKHERRVDGRRLDETRKITAQIDVLPRVHGSSLFSRGETQVLNVLTLGTLRDAQTLDGMEEFIEAEKPYIHHYNFPSYSVGETGRYGPVGRREIGHGALAERALLPVLPKESDFPYTMRLVSECLGSNGSTSMASTCASTLSLMAGGVPIKDMVGGVAMGLVMEQPKNELKDLSNVVIETERLRLRPIRIEDAQDIIDIFSPEVNKTLSYNEYHDIEKANEFVKECIEDIKLGVGISFIVESKDGKFLGSVSIDHFDKPELSVGIYFRQEYWGQGFGFESMNAVVKWAESTYKYKYIEYGCLVGNEATIKIAEKCGGKIASKNLLVWMPNKKETTQLDLYYIPHPTYKPTYKVLTDIQGLEDHHGDMDFKVTGTRDGITAIQLDNKVAGLTPQILKEALIESKKGRLYILDVMKECISEPKAQISQYAQKVISIQVPMHKIRDVIGSGGKIINGLQDKFGVKIDLENETGQTYIYGKENQAVEDCKLEILSMIKEYQVGDKVSAKVLRIQPFGAFVTMDGGSMEAMIHISKMSKERIEKVEDALKLGDVVDCKVLEIKDNGNISLGVILKD
jgi:polyribonucleotide nucleotidyltransferase/GNAT superfamily N-acetyltransferase